jgi:hypothetical protein
LPDDRDRRGAGGGVDGDDDFGEDGALAWREVAG